MTDDPQTTTDTTDPAPSPLSRASTTTPRDNAAPVDPAPDAQVAAPDAAPAPAPEPAPAPVSSDQIAEASDLAETEASTDEQAEISVEDRLSLVESRLAYLTNLFGWPENE